MAPQYGDDSLRYAMVISTMAGLVAVALFYAAAKCLPADLAKRSSEQAAAAVA